MLLTVALFPAPRLLIFKNLLLSVVVQDGFNFLCPLVFKTPAVSCFDSLGCFHLFSIRCGGDLTAVFGVLSLKLVALADFSIFHAGKLLLYVI